MILNKEREGREVLKREKLKFKAKLVEGISKLHPLPKKEKREKERKEKSRKGEKKGKKKKRTIKRKKV